MRISSDEWRPVGIASLEPAAMGALREPSNACIIAGPGAGKTELLAQRAAYLLQTGLCPPPYRILAISFKADAATNLERRVASRCSSEQAARFSSMTFEAFAKGLVDRFRQNIPAAWRPTQRYDIVNDDTRAATKLLALAARTAPNGWRADIEQLDPRKFERRHLGSFRLPIDRTLAASAVEHAVLVWWREHFGDVDCTKLSFTMINRLAEVLLRTSKRIRHALRKTYRFVFVDEYQDTTYAQYDFLCTAFGGASAVVTAVGDHKQRIMTWAGARTDAVTRFVADFRARRFDLQMNYRSSPELVRIQQVVALALDANSATVASQRPSAIADEAAQIWGFPSAGLEAARIAAWIRDDMDARALRPRDFVVLVRQKAESYEAALSQAFKPAGLMLRNEARKLTL